MCVGAQFPHTQQGAEAPAQHNSLFYLGHTFVSLLVGMGADQSAEKGAETRQLGADASIPSDRHGFGHRAPLFLSIG